MNRNINNLKKIVIKIGSSLISEDKLLSEKRILNWAKQISELRKEGKEIDEYNKNLVEEAWKKQLEKQ